MFKLLCSFSCYRLEDAKVEGKFDINCLERGDCDDEDRKNISPLFKDSKTVQEIEKCVINKCPRKFDDTNIRREINKGKKTNSYAIIVPIMIVLISVICCCCKN